MPDLLPLNPLSAQPKLVPNWRDAMRRSHRNMSKALRCGSRRKGAAVVELAACLPVMVLLMFASIEGCNMIFLKQGLTSAAYESARVALHSRATSTLAMARANEVLTSRRIQGATVTFSPATVETVVKGQPFTVTVSAPCSRNANGPEWFFSGRVLSSSVTMVKE